MQKVVAHTPKISVLRILEQLGFKVLQEADFVSMVRQNGDGSKTFLTLPNHPSLKTSTLQIVLNQAGIPWTTFLKKAETRQAWYSDNATQL
jgi:hypothetical protein